MTLAKLIETVSQRCVFLEQNPGLVSALTRYHWWPADIAGNVCES